MLTELLEQDHRQEIGPEEATRRRVERCRRLADRLAFAAGELLPDGLDHLPLPRDHLQRLGDILTQFRQAPRAAARTGRRRRNDNAFTRQVFGEWLFGGTLANERPNRRGLGCRFFSGKLILARRRLGVLELHLELIEKAGLALRTCPIKLAPQLLDLQRQMRDQGFGVRRCRFDPRRIRRGLCEIACRTRQIALGQIRTPFGCNKSALQSNDVVRRSGHGKGLEAVRDAIDSATKPLQCNAFRLSDRQRTPGSLGISPINPFEQITHLRG